jgi:hypothetical protein
MIDKRRSQPSVLPLSSSATFRAAGCLSTAPPIGPGASTTVGTSGSHFKNAPVVGKLMAELITEVEAGHDHDNDPVQLFFRYTRRTCNIGFFSRLRELNPESSYSVLGEGRAVSQSSPAETARTRSTAASERSR